jgi:hypothetical protein
MSHPLVLAVFNTASEAAHAARALHEIGIARDQISVVARNHEEEGALARELDASPGADIEDSRPAAVLGELSAQVLAAIALVLPGVGPIVTAGPLAAGLGEAAGHVAGSVASVLKGVGVNERRAEQIQRAVEHGALLIGVHATEQQLEAIQKALGAAGAVDVELAHWGDAY